MTEREKRKKFHYLYKSDNDLKNAIDKALIDRPKMNFRQMLDESIKLNPNINKYLTNNERTNLLNS